MPDRPFLLFTTSCQTSPILAFLFPFLFSLGIDTSPLFLEVGKRSRVVDWPVNIFSFSDIVVVATDWLVRVPVAVCLGGMNITDSWVFFSFSIAWKMMTVLSNSDQLLVLFFLAGWKLLVFCDNFFWADHLFKQDNTQLPIRHPTYSHPRIPN